MSFNARATKNVIIVDDEPAAISHLRSVIDGFDALTVVAEAGDGESAIKAILAHQPDIVFLDIEMPEVNGFEVVKATAKEHYQLVFVTAYDQYALDAFDTHAIDYLLKPVRPSLLEKCINKILHQEELVLEGLQKQKTSSDTLVLSDGNAMRVLDHKHVCFIEGIGRYRRIHLTGTGKDLQGIATIVSDTTLDEFESQLPASGFMRIHRSFIVNTFLIIGVNIESRRHFVSLTGTEGKIPVSRSKVADLKAMLNP